MGTTEPNEIYECPVLPCVYYVTDKHGEGWYCTGTGLSSEGGSCVHEDDLLYDRNFGG